MSTVDQTRTKFSVGYYLTEKEDSPTCFSELARRFAPRLKEVYFPWPGLAHGRASHTMPNEEERSVADLKYCRDHGMKLDLLANAMCYGEKSCTAEQHRQIVDIVKRLDKFGLYPEIVTTTSPYIARLFKLEFPDIEVRASVNMELRNTLALEYLSPLFDSFYISRDVQRDLPTFRRFADWCREHDRKLCLLANSCCLRNCPWHASHDAVLAHMNSNSLQGVDEENCKLLCFDNHPYEEFLRPGWIRPEDVPLFEPELEIVKLATRTVSAKYTLEIVEAYLNHSYDGNLLRLLNPYHGFEFRPYRIDNKSFPADWITSGIAGKCAEYCTHCGKCEKLLKQVMKYDVDPTVRATSYSFGTQFVPRQAQKKPDAPSASGERKAKGASS